jgi:hypothetical protein
MAMSAPNNPLVKAGKGEKAGSGLLAGLEVAVDEIFRPDL